ncbi:hypothetical protein [Dinoroseobacter sp. PD6]
MAIQSLFIGLVFILGPVWCGHACYLFPGSVPRRRLRGKGPAP